MKAYNFEVSTQMSSIWVFVLQLREFLTDLRAELTKQEFTQQAQTSSQWSELRTLILPGNLKGVEAA